MATAETVNWEEILKGSASYNMYKNFDVEVKEKAEGKPDHCKKIKEIVKSYKEEAYELCRKMESSLEYLQKVVVVGTRRYSCIHYKYWMSHKLLNMFKKDSENEPDKSVLDKFVDAQNTFIKNNNDYGCIYDYKDVNMKYLQEMDDEKYLHDYFRSYNTIKVYISRASSKKEICKEYLEHIGKLYEKYKEKCSDGYFYWASDCPLYFKRQGKYDPKKLCAQLDPPCLNNRDGQPSEGKEDSGTSQKKKKITFYHLKCKNKVKGDYMRCALIPSTMEYTENEDKIKGNVEKAGKVTFVAPDPSIALGGILKKREQKTGQGVESGTSDSTDDFQIVSSASSDDQYNSQYLTEADGISPYLVQTEKGIKWRIHDKETLDCKNYGSEDPYGLCKHLYDLHQKGDFKLNPNPNFRKARSRMSSLEGEDSFPDDGLYEMEDDDTYPSDTGNDMFSLLKTKQFRTGTTIALMLGTFFLGFAYYKYTPLGSFFRGKKGARRNIDHEYFERKSEELPRRSQQSNYNLRDKELYKSYNELNQKCSWSYRDLYCSDALTSFVDDSIRPLYKKLWNNFFKVKYYSGDFKYLTKDKKKICTYLKYWFYDQLLSKNVSDKVIEKFFSDWESTTKSYNLDTIGCELYKMNLNEIKETKMLYDYFLLHDGYIINDLVNHKIYVSPYCQYLKKAEDVYKMRKSECASDNNSGRCKEFKKYIRNQMIKNDITLFKGKCKNEEQRVERMDAAEAILNPALKELVKKGESLKSASIYKFYEFLNKAYSKNGESSTCDLLARSNGINGRHIYRYCNMLKELLDNWDSTLSSLGMDENNNKMCEYLNYWIHHKTKGNRHRSKFIKLFYYTWDILNNLKTKNNHCEHKNFNIGEREFTRKKDLYEFLEFYDSIKGKLENGGSPNNAEYCDYIKSNFEKYYYMVQEDKCKKSSIYSDETLLFQKKFKDTNEIPSLNEKCGGKYLDLVFKEEFEEMNSRDNLPEANRRGSYSPNADTVALTKGEFSERSRTVENVLKQLPSHKTYEKLNSKENVDKYCSDCMDIIHLEFDHPGINHFCRMLSKNLRELSEMESANSKDRCEYFTHWMNEEIWKKLSNSNSFTLNIPLVNILLNIGHTINNKLRKNHCPYDFNRNYTYKELQERKDLHDFFKNYKKIETKDSSISISDQALCAYVSYIYKLYKRHIGGCCEYYDKNNHNEEHCQDYFKCDSKLNPNNLLIKLNCNEKESVEDSQKIFEKLTIDRGVILFTEKSKQRYKELATGNYYHPSNLKTLFNKIMQDGDPFYLATTSLLALLGVLLMFFVFYKVKADCTTNCKYDKILLIVYSFKTCNCSVNELHLYFFSPFVRQFTPLGIWIDRTSKKRGNHYPYEEPRSRFIYSSSEPENIIPQGRRLNIAYHTA